MSAIFILSTATRMPSTNKAKILFYSFQHLKTFARVSFFLVFLSRSSSQSGSEGRDRVVQLVLLLFWGAYTLLVKWILTKAADCCFRKKIVHFIWKIMLIVIQINKNSSERGFRRTVARRKRISDGLRWVEEKANRDRETMPKMVAHSCHGRLLCRVSHKILWPASKYFLCQMQVSPNYKLKI